MAAPVPAVMRAERILDTLAASPRRGYTAAELAVAVGVHRSTCFSLLACLTELGLVEREPGSKYYRLGPKLLALGTAAAERYSASAESRREMYALAADLDVGILVCAAVDDHLVMLDRAGSEVADFGMPPRHLVTSELAPPIGAIFVAWSSPEAIEQWIARAPASATATDLESYRRSVAAVRARGYSIGSVVEVERQLEEILGRLQQTQRTERLRAALELADLVRWESKLSDDEARGGAVDHLIGPVFDDTGQVGLTFTMFGRPGQIRGDNLATYAEPLMASCQRLSRTLGRTFVE